MSVAAAARPAWLRREARAIAVLAVPIIVGKLSLMGQNTLDVMLAGHFSAHVLGAVAVGGGVWWLAQMAQAGLLLAVSPFVSQLDGAGRRAEAGPVFIQALWLALLVGLPLAATVAWLLPLLVAVMGVAPELLPDVNLFLHAIAPAAPAVGILVACMSFSEGLSMPRHSMAFGLLGLLLLGPLGWTLMYGGLGGRPLGALGSGLANAVVVWVQAAGFLAWIAWSGRYAGLGWQRAWWPQAASMRAILVTGVPIAVSQLLESGLFTTAGLLIGRFGAAAAASHLVALNMAALAFMVPLGLAFATTVRVGNAVGRADALGVRRSGLTGILLAVAVQSLAAILMLTMPRHLVLIYTDDPAVVARATVLLRLAGIFAFSDGLQVAAIAALRGLKDTRGPMLITAIAYWGVGLPVALFCAFGLGMEAPGVWIGLIAGLLVAAVLLCQRFLRSTRPHRGLASERPRRIIEASTTERR